VLAAEFSRQGFSDMRSSLVLAFGLALLAGCSLGGGPTTDLAESGKRFLLAEEPGEVIGILDYRDAPPEKAEVALLGRIGGTKQTWSASSAEFVMSDPTHEPDTTGHVCTNDNCPFCKGKQPPSQAHAIVMLTDDAGRVPAVDARRLLPLAEGQLVVVRGQAEVNPIGQLVVKARGVYLRR
jgi:hypothetical protein